jgi:probable DNA metabolism protein
LGFQLGSKINDYHTHPHILPVNETARKVTFEAHRFLGLLRFIECNQYLYAEFEPDHNILVLLAGHFADRLAKENFIIHDRRRHLAVVYDQKEWLLTDFAEEKKNGPSADEMLLSGALVKIFFSHRNCCQRK